MVRCSIKGCKSDSERKITGLSFHTFPPDPFREAIWAAATGRVDWKPTKHSRICSLHFEEGSITIRNKVKRVESTAYPSVNVHAFATPIIHSVCTLRSSDTQLSQEIPNNVEIKTEECDPSITVDCHTMASPMLVVHPLKLRSTSDEIEIKTEECDSSITEQCYLNSVNESDPLADYSESSTRTQVKTKCPSATPGLTRNEERLIQKIIKLRQSAMKLKRKLRSTRESRRRFMKKNEELKMIVEYLKSNR